MFTCPSHFPVSFREDVVRVARNREPGQRLVNIAKGFGFSETCLSNWLKSADVEDGLKPGVTNAENAELREAKK
jgi:transposase